MHRFRGELSSVTAGVGEDPPRLCGGTQFLPAGEGEAEFRTVDDLGFCQPVVMQVGYVGEVVAVYDQAVEVQPRAAGVWG